MPVSSDNQRTDRLLFLSQVNIISRISFFINTKLINFIYKKNIYKNNFCIEKALTFDLLKQKIMNTYLNLQIELSQNREEMQKQIYYLSVRPLLVRIQERGYREQTKLRISPNYYPQQSKRISKNFIN